MGTGVDVSTTYCVHPATVVVTVLVFVARGSLCSSDTAAGFADSTGPAVLRVDVTNTEAGDRDADILARIALDRARLDEEGSSALPRSESGTACQPFTVSLAVQRPSINSDVRVKVVYHR